MIKKKNLDYTNAFIYEEINGSMKLFESWNNSWAYLALCIVEFLVSWIHENSQMQKLADFDKILKSQNPWYNKIIILIY